jgi:hypothetical protein
MRRIGPRTLAGIWAAYEEIRDPSRFSFEQEGPYWGSDVWALHEDRVDLFSSAGAGGRAAWNWGFHGLGLGAGLSLGWTGLHLSERSRDLIRAVGPITGDYDWDWAGNVHGSGLAVENDWGLAWPRNARLKVRFHAGLRFLWVPHLRGTWAATTTATGDLSGFSGQGSGDAVWVGWTDPRSGNKGYGIAQQADLASDPTLEEAAFVALGLRLQAGLVYDFQGP